MRTSGFIPLLPTESPLSGKAQRHQWRYVGTKENPADDASRGRRAGDFIKNNRWIEGPKFLCKPDEDWPVNMVDSAVDAAVANKQSALVQGNRISEDTTREQTLSAEDLMEAELAIICYCQQQRFSEEITALSSGKDVVSKQSAIYKLDPWLDNGLLRVGGWLTWGSLPEDTKQNILLTKDQHVAALTLKDLHQQLGHSGHNHMLSVLRRRYWITGATSAVRKIIAEYCFCKKYNGRMMGQKMADLPQGEDSARPSPIYQHRH